MHSGAVSFEEIVSSVKDETGIVNMRPYYDKLRRFIFRAERDIGYGGSVVLKKLVFKKGINFDGKYFKFPDDYLELEGVGQCSGRFRDCDINIVTEGVRLRTVQQTCTLLYWALACDGYGNPITTRNHEDAVIAYCVWKMYAPKRFNDQGNANSVFAYKQEWISECLSARGDDAFPTLEQWNEIALVSYADRRGLLQQPTASYNYCDDMINSDCEIIDDITKVFFWQLQSISEDLDSVKADFSQMYLESKPFMSLPVFEQGFVVNYETVGKICFAVQKTQSTDWQITDFLNNDLTDQFQSFYDDLTKTAVFVSNNNYNYGSIYFKFKKIL